MMNEDDDLNINLIMGENFIKFIYIHKVVFKCIYHNVHFVVKMTCTVTIFETIS